MDKRARSTRARKSKGREGLGREAGTWPDSPCFARNMGKRGGLISQRRWGGEENARRADQGGWPNRERPREGKWV